LYDSLVVKEVAWAEGAGVRAIAPDGTLLGPFNPLLFSPALGAAQVGVFRADKAATSLSPRVHEIVVLTVGAAWRSDYELYAHGAMAKAAGVPDAVIRALASGQAPTFESDEEATAHAFTWQLATRHRVDHDTYANAARTFGDKGLVDMVMLIGLYLATCAIINAFEVRLRTP
jgi:4-carboxymuconolactone decarboxylase